MHSNYIFLFLAIICEVAGTLFLPASQGFKKFLPTMTLGIFYFFAFYFLSRASETIPLAVMYATWSGLGIFTLAILSFLIFQQNLGWQAILGLILIVVGVFLVNKGN
jgi:small multidrug resistance pump